MVLEDFSFNLITNESEKKKYKFKNSKICLKYDSLVRMAPISCC